MKVEAQQWEEAIGIDSEREVWRDAKLSGEFSWFRQDHNVLWKLGWYAGLQERFEIKLW